MPNQEGLKRSYAERTKEAREKALQAVNSLKAEKAQINFSAVAARSGISRHFLYGDQEVRRIIGLFDNGQGSNPLSVNDAEAIFQYSGIEYTKDENGMLVLEKYRPKIIINKGKVPPISFYEMKIDEYALLSKVSKINGTIVVPADKSITHRAIMLSSLAEGKSYVNNFGKCLKIF